MSTVQTVEVSGFAEAPQVCVTSHRLLDVYQESEFWVPVFQYPSGCDVGKGEAGMLVAYSGKVIKRIFTP